MHLAICCGIDDADYLLRTRARDDLAHVYNLLNLLARPAGLEPAAYCLEGT